MHSTTNWMVALAALATTPATQAAADGFQAKPAPDPPGTLHTLASGEILAYDGATLERFAADGQPLGTVYSLPATGTPGCFAVSPDETRALLGEQMSGDLFAIDLLSGTGAPLANLAWNADAVFETSDTAIVSAATCGFFCGNDLVRVHMTTGGLTYLANVAGGSGPVEVGAGGDLYYATVGDGFTVPFGSTVLLEFEAAKLTGAPVLTEADARVIRGGFFDGADLAIDPSLGRLFLAEGFLFSPTRLVAVEIATGADATLFEGTGGVTFSNLQFITPGEEVPFLPYQPSAGGRLLFRQSDFGGTAERRELVPLRPSLELTGPGVSGAGRVDLVVSDAPPFGLVAIAACDFTAFSPAETSFEVGGLPLVHLGLDPASTIQLPLPLAVDGSGNATFSFSNAGGLADALAVQGVVADPSPAIVGSTSVATL